MSSSKHDDVLSNLNASHTDTTGSKADISRGKRDETSGGIERSDDEIDALMDYIEEVIVLPPNAYPFESYGRNYAFSGSDRLRAVYLIPSPIFDENTLCVDGRGVPCSEATRAKYTEDSIRYAASMAAAGKRRFYASAEELPNIMDGGCSIVRIEYDLPTKRILYAACSPR